MDETDDSYTAPEVTEIGTVADLTGADVPGSGDGGNQDPVGGIIETS